MDPAAIRSVAVIGAGLMGHGIAQEFAAKGYAVRLHDRADEALRTAMDHIERNLAQLGQLGLLAEGEVVAARANLRPVADLREAVAEADLVVEAVFEDLALKQRLFGELDRFCPARTILASNSSSFLPSLLATATQRPDRVLVAHYFNPPYLVPLVELVRHAHTSDATIGLVEAVLTRMGKRPIVVQREVPGFLVNRLQTALGREALWLVQEGIASPEAIDTAITASIGRRWAAVGLFALCDLAGWDTIEQAYRVIAPALASSPDVPPVLRDLVAEGHLGVKAGQGVYGWTPETAEAVRQRLALALREIARWG